MVPRQVCTVTRKPTKKSTPSEHCTRVPREFCFPRGSSCNIVKSEKECREQVRVEVIEVPTEKCSVQPIPRCWQETEVFPILDQVEECLDVPREICNEARKQPRKVLKPVVKRDCHRPSTLLSVLP